MADMDQETANKMVIEALQKKQKTKSKFYFSDLQDILGLKPREAKKFVNKMVEAQILEFWSSGSTTMYGLKGTGYI